MTQDRESPAFAGLSVVISCLYFISGVKLFALGMVPARVGYMQLLA
jgi:hypothetical protein